MTVPTWCGVRWPLNVGPELCPECLNYVDVFEKDDERGFQHHLKSWTETSVTSCDGKPEKEACT
ncbi:MAG TPA: hypothetical protein VFN81_06655 [Sphingomicrobium sp.]|nr:hypothetical protein [Sphingomicrobium sp.]